uniref:hypothetical protein n=1 Tax=Falsiroseomonas oryziterrae TaxID=2911368 RepID=UPI001F42078B
ALLVASRQLLREPDPAAAARAAIGRMPRGSLSVEEVLGHVRVAALLPLTDDGVARVSAAMVAAAFSAEFRAAWQRAKD